jgi:hypothetical protein
LNSQQQIAILLVAMLCAPAVGAGQSFEVVSRGWTTWQMMVNEGAASQKGDPPQVAARNALVDPASASASNSARLLHVFVLVGDGAVNQISSKSANPFIVEVRDQRNLPVEGAEVLLKAPPNGPSGVFADQQLTWTGFTDANGQVVVAGFTANKERGRFSINVTARRAGNAGTAIIAQTNSSGSEAAPKSKASLWWKIALVAAGCGAAVGIALAVHDSGNPSTVVLQPGPVSIGTPR